MKTGTSSVGITLLALAILSILLDTPYCKALCPSQYSEKGNSCYRFVASEAINWDSAESKCTADNGHLASISDQAENDYVHGLGASARNFWIGLNDKTTEGTYVWTDGTAFSFTAWRDGQPKASRQDGEDCVQMKSNSGKWDDKSCAALKAYVCERNLLISTTSSPTRTTDLSSNGGTGTTLPSITNSNAGTTLTSLPVTSTEVGTSTEQTGTTSITSHLPISTTQVVAVTHTSNAATTAKSTLRTFTTKSTTESSTMSTKRRTSSVEIGTTMSNSPGPVSIAISSMRQTSVPRSTDNPTLHSIAVSGLFTTKQFDKPMPSSQQHATGIVTDATGTDTVADATGVATDTVKVTTDATEVVKLQSAASSNIAPVAASTTAAGCLLLILLLLFVFCCSKYHRKRKHKREAKKTLPFTDNAYDMAIELINQPLTEDDVEYETLTELLSLPDSGASSVANANLIPVFSCSTLENDLPFVIDGDRYLDPATIFEKKLVEVAAKVDFSTQAEFKSKRTEEQEPNQEEEDCEEEAEERQYSVIFSQSNDAEFWQPATQEEEIYAQLTSNQFLHIDPLAVTTTERLGSGEFGTVDKGILQLSEQKKVLVAVKTLHARSADARVRFLREAAIMGQFHNKNVVRMYGVVTAASPMRIVLEYMGKGDLKNHLLTLRPWSNGEWCHSGTSSRLLQITRDVANGMAYLASKSFVHRDLAARNVLVGRRGVCKIADFGLTRDLADDSYYISHGGKLPIRWTAPEAINYLKYTAASDVWSYAILLFEIWSLGERPFGFTRNAEVLSKTEQGYRLPPTPGCPRLIYGLMIDCWNPDYNQRPAFTDIVCRLSVVEEELLAINQQDRHLVGRLGDALESSANAYRDLQERYL